MTSSTEHRTGTDKLRGEQASLAAGRAAGYCWDRNPNGAGRCTWPPNHAGRRHEDVYAHTEWYGTSDAGTTPTAPASDHH